MSIAVLHKCLDSLVVVVKLTEKRVACHSIDARTIGIEILAHEEKQPMQGIRVRISLHIENGVEHRISFIVSFPSLQNGCKGPAKGKYIAHEALGQETAPPQKDQNLSI